eukprot:SAG31_NODE_1590_length_7805_cov_3.417390_5_plen_245_part_00
MLDHPSLHRRKKRQRCGGDRRNCGGVDCAGWCWRGCWRRAAGCVGITIFPQAVSHGSAQRVGAASSRVSVFYTLRCCGAVFIPHARSKLRRAWVCIRVVSSLARKPGVAEIIGQAIAGEVVVVVCACHDRRASVITSASCCFRFTWIFVLSSCASKEARNANGKHGTQNYYHLRRGCQERFAELCLSRLVQVVKEACCVEACCVEACCVEACLHTPGLESHVRRVLLNLVQLSSVPKLRYYFEV